MASVIVQLSSISAHLITMQHKQLQQQRATTTTTISCKLLEDDHTHTYISSQVMLERVFEMDSKKPHAMLLFSSQTFYLLVGTGQ